MIFRKFLNMSILLVVSFLCFYFYEASIHEKYEVHNRVMQSILDEQKNHLDLLFHQFYPSAENIEPELKLANNIISDYGEFIRAVKRNDNLGRKTVEKLLLKYKVEKNFNWSNENFSLIIQKKFFDAIQKEVDGLSEQILERRKYYAGNNIKVIIADREKSYVKDSIYELNLEVVELYNYDVEDKIASYIIDNQETSLEKFPIEIQSKPDSITFKIRGTNVVTGEKFKIREKHSLDSKIFP